ncbi:hypothetical protein GGI21_000107, partial [Coemansia aciculifera]
MPSNSTTSNSTQLKRKAAHGGSVLETDPQDWMHRVDAASPKLQPFGVEATQPPRKRRHATEAMTTGGSGGGHDRLCSMDL